MKRFLTKSIAYVGAFIALLVPVVVFATDCNSSTSVCNVLGDITFSRFLELALRAFVLLSLPVLAFFIVLAGFNFILARGNSDKLTLAKWNFLYVIIGTTLILGAWVFANLIGGTVASISS